MLLRVVQMGISYPRTIQVFTSITLYYCGLIDNIRFVQKIIQGVFILVGGNLKAGGSVCVGPRGVQLLSYGKLRGFSGTCGSEVSESTRPQNNLFLK